MKYFDISILPSTIIIYKPYDFKFFKLLYMYFLDWNPMQTYRE